MEVLCSVWAGALMPITHEIKKPGLSQTNVETIGDARYLKLDQTTPQDVDNGTPTFNQGIKIKAGQKLYFDAP